LGLSPTLSPVHTFSYIVLVADVLETSSSTVTQPFGRGLGAERGIEEELDIEGGNMGGESSKAGMEGRREELRRTNGVVKGVVKVCVSGKDWD
jgi:hypothetical protein